jgi:hypothetical protein
MVKTFPDNRVHNRPYRVFFASGDWTCSVARFTGTMKGPMKGAGGKEIPPTGKSFAVDFCTVARWENGEIVDENLFYDVVGLMGQIGVGGRVLSDTLDRRELGGLGARRVRELETQSHPIEILRKESGGPVNQALGQWPSRRRSG